MEMSMKNPKRKAAGICINWNRGKLRPLITMEIITITMLKMMDSVPTDSAVAKDKTVGIAITGPVPKLARMEMAMPKAKMNNPRVNRVVR